MRGVYKGIYPNASWTKMETALGCWLRHEGDPKKIETPHPHYKAVFGVKTLATG